MVSACVPSTQIFRRSMLGPESQNAPPGAVEVAGGSWTAPVDAAGVGPYGTPSITYPTPVPPEAIWIKIRSHVHVTVDSWIGVPGVKVILRLLRSACARRGAVNASERARARWRAKRKGPTVCMGRTPNKFGKARAAGCG